jgi:hypothetical protein
VRLDGGGGMSEGEKGERRRMSRSRTTEERDSCRGHRERGRSRRREHEMGRQQEAARK